MTSTKYVKAHEAAKKAQGLKEFRRLWGYPDDEKAIREYAAKLTLKRAKDKQS
jgi:hypothetical protein